MLFFLLLHSITRCHAYATKASFSPGSRAKVNIIWPTPTPFLCFKWDTQTNAARVSSELRGVSETAFCHGTSTIVLQCQIFWRWSLLLNIKDLITATEIPNVNSWVSMGIFWGMLTVERRARMEKKFSSKSGLCNSECRTYWTRRLFVDDTTMLNANHKKINDISDSVPALSRRRLPQTTSFAEELSWMFRFHKIPRTSWIPEQISV